MPGPVLWIFLVFHSTDLSCFFEHVVVLFCFDMQFFIFYFFIYFVFHHLFLSVGGLLLYNIVVVFAIH